MANVEIAVMEVDLPDASKARNVDMQILQVIIPNAPAYSQNIKLPKTARVAQFIVPEGAEYSLKLGYGDDNGVRSVQISWGEEVKLTHKDTLSPDAPGPFGEIRMIDEYVEEGGGSPDVPGSTTTPAPVPTTTTPASAPTTTTEAVVTTTTAAETTTSEVPSPPSLPPVDESTTSQPSFDEDVTSIDPLP